MNNTNNILNFNKNKLFKSNLTSHLNNYKVQNKHTFNEKIEDTLNYEVNCSDLDQQLISWVQI